MPADVALPPVVFTDATGRHWYPLFDDHVIAWLRQCAELDLEALIARDDPYEVLDTFNHESRIALALLAASFAAAGFGSTVDGFTAARTAMELGIPPDDAGAINRAVTALYQSLRRRWPRSDALARLARVQPKLRVALRALGESID